MADNAELVDRMRKSGKASFQDILVFNELSALTRKANADPQAPLSAGLEGLMAVYDHLYSYGFSLAGYQFVGLAALARARERDSLVRPVRLLPALVRLRGELLLGAAVVRLLRRRGGPTSSSWRGWITTACGSSCRTRCCSSTRRPSPSRSTCSIILPNCALNALSAVLSLGFVVHWRMIVAPQQYADGKGKPLRRRISEPAKPN